MKNKDQIRRLPGVDIVLKQKSIADMVEKYGHQLVTALVREIIRNNRSEILKGKKAPDMELIVADVHQLAQSISRKSLKKVFNATGIILNTNLGRAPLGEKVLADLADIVLGYSNLEFNLEMGSRGQRGMHVDTLLKFICGAEDVLVVNNNAAGILLALNTLANQKEVIVSRGELVEIGGSFRIPDIMAASGAKMVEVGTTNKTHLSDYEKAITEDTALILKVHKSNYSIQGFTKEVPLKELVELAHSKGLAVLYDIGSGLLKKLGPLSSTDEPDVRTALSDGADMVTFSGDKLLGGPQAGILAGKKELISCMSSAPLMRALRVGKLTHTALSSVIRSFLDDQSLVDSIPIYRMLQRTEKEINKSAVKLLKKITASGIQAKIVKTYGQCGGGTLPSFKINSYAIALVFNHKSQKMRSAAAERVYYKLLALEFPIIGILRRGEVIFDLLTISEADIAYIGAEVAKAAIADLKT